MAKKNEILLSIGLEGDQDVKSKLKAVGDAGKQSLQGFEKKLGDSKSGLGGLGQSAGKLKEAFEPLTEASGLAGLAGLTGLGGIFGRLASGPAGIIAGITGVLLGMAKVGEETDKAKLKLKALGASGDTFEKLNKAAQDLGISTENLQPSFEKFAANKNKINADQNSGVIRLRPNGATEADQAAAGVRVIGGGGKETRPPVPDDVFIGALKTLIEGAQAEKIPGDEAGKIADAFSSKVQEDRKLSPEAVDTLNPASQNILAKSLSPFFGRDLLNGADLKEQLARPGQRPPSDNEVFRSLNAAEPEAQKQAESAHGLTAAFDALLAATKHLAESFSGDIGIADAIGKLVKVINNAADNADRIIHPRDYQPGGPKFIGPVSAAERTAYNEPDLIDLGKTLLTGKTDPRFADSNAAKVAKFLRNGPAFLQQTPEQALDRYQKNRSSLPTTEPLITPEQLGNTAIPSPLELFQKRQPAAIPSGFEQLSDGTIIKSSPPAPELPTTAPLITPEQLGNTVIPSPLELFKKRQPAAIPEQQSYGTIIKSLPPASPAPAPVQPEEAPQTQPPAREQFGEAQAPQQLSDLRTAIPDALRSLVQGITDKANGFNPQDTKVQGPVDGLGIRGEAPAPEAATSNVAALDGAAGDAVAGLRQLAAVLANFQGGAGAPALQTVQAAAGGGEIRHLDGGGHLSGPGTSTSDSIPAMLSDGEYVIKASSARKIGRDRLDQLNASGYADGGSVARTLRNVRKFADGGDASNNGVSRSVASQSSLGPGDHEVTYDPQTGGAFVDGILHLPGDPLLDDPVVKQGMAQSKAGMSAQPSKGKYKSDFVGRFGEHAEGGPIGHFAAGGAIGRGLGAAHFANGGRVSLAPALHLADGGGADGLGAAAPTVDAGALSAPGGSLGHLDVDLRTNHGDFKMMAPEDVARQMTRAAGDAALAQTGPRPAWYEGR